MFAQILILPREVLNAKKPKRVSKKKAGPAQSAAKRSRGGSARSR